MILTANQHRQVSFWLREKGDWDYLDRQYAVNRPMDVETTKDPLLLLFSAILDDLQGPGKCTTAFHLVQQKVNPFVPLCQAEFWKIELMIMEESEIGAVLTTIEKVDHPLKDRLGRQLLDALELYVISRTMQRARRINETW